MPGAPAATAAGAVPAATAATATAAVPGSALRGALAEAEPAEVLGGYLHAWAAGFLRSLRRHEESAGSAQAAPAAAEAVRQLRAAARRIGSVLSTYRPLVDAAWADELSGELRRLSGTLAREYRCAARQSRLLGALHRLAVEGAGGDRAAALLERQHTLARSRAHSAALEELVSSRFHAVADAVTVLAYEVPLAPGGRTRGARRADEVLAPLAEEARERLVQAVDALPSASRSLAPAAVPAPVGAPAGTATGLRTRGARRGAARERPEGAAAGFDLQAKQDAAWFEVRTLLRHHRYAQEVLYAAVSPPGGADAAAARPDQGAAPGLAGPTASTDQAVPAEPPGAGPEFLREAPGPLLVAASAALDRYRDAVEAADAAASAARTPRIAPATAYALGVLHAGQRQDAETARREFTRIWEQVTEGDPCHDAGRAAARQEAASQPL